MVKDDFTNLWKNKQTDGKPRASVIGGLQRLVKEKDNEILELKENLINLREKLNQDVEILAQSEEIITNQKAKIEDLNLKLEEAQAQVSVLSNGEKSFDLPESPTSGMAKMSSSDSEEVRRLKRKIKTMEDKLYVFSTLPDRITTLEEQKQKDAALVDDLEERNRDLRKKLQEMAEADEAVKMLQEKDEKIEQLTRENNKLSQVVEELETELISPKGVNPQAATTENGDQWRNRYERARKEYEKVLKTYQATKEELESTKNQLAKSKQQKPVVEQPPSRDFQVLINENENLKQDLAEAKSKISELESKQLVEIENKPDIKSLDDSSSLRLKINEMQTEMDDLKTKLDESSKTYEDLLFKYQQKDKDDSKQQLIDELQQKLNQSRGKTEDLEAEVAKLQSACEDYDVKIKEYAAKDKATQSANFDGLLGELQTKIDKQDRQIKKLKQENKTLESLKGKATQLEELEKENVSLKNQLDQLKKASSDASDSQADLDSIKNQLQDLKQENLKLKEKVNAAEGADSSNLLSLVQDLQSKLNRVKKENMKLKKQLEA